MEKQKEEISWVENIFNKLTAPKTIKICGYTAIIVFFGLMITAILVALPPGPIHPDAYNIFDNWISDMGNHEHTPAPFLLDTVLIATGALLIPFTFYLERHLAPIPKTIEDLDRTPHRWIYRLMSMAFFFNLIGSIGMFGVGIFSEDRDYLLPGSHFVFSVILFGAFALGGMCLGLVIMIDGQQFVPKPLNFILGAYGVHGLMIVGVVTAMDLKPLTEWIIFFALIAWILPLFFFTLVHANKQLEKTHQTENLKS